MSRPGTPTAAPHTRKTPRQAVLVMGMHRSGTSALSGILGKLGVQPPRTLMPPTDDNPRGYWESTKLMGFHDELLRSGGSTWSDWDAFNPDWTASSAADAFRERLPRIIEHEFGDAPLFLVKDPRISRFARFWLDALESMSIVPKVVVCVRHPREVAQSLESRNDFGRKRAQLIWLRHMLDAEYATRGTSRSFVHYGALLQDWAGQVRRLGKELDIPWPRWSSEVEAEIDRFLTSSLRRNVVDSSGVSDESALGTWIATSYRIFRELGEGGEASAGTLAQLDEVRSAFDDTSAIYGAVVREQELKAGEHLDALNQDLAKETEQAAALREQLEAATQALHSARSTIAVRDREIAQWAEANRSGEAERVRMHEEYQATGTGMVEWLKEGEAELKRVREADAEEYAAVLTGERQAQAEVVARLSTAHARALARMRDAHAVALGKRERVREALEATLEERFNEIAHLSRLLLDQEGQVEALKQRLSEAEAAHADALRARDAAHEEALGTQQRAAEESLARQRQASDARLKDTIAAHERRIAELGAERTVVVSALKRASDEKQQELEDLQQRMAKAVAARESRLEQQSRDHARDLARSEQVAAERQVLLDALVRELQVHRDDVRRLAGELKALRNSRSWQLTAVLRRERKHPPSSPVSLSVHEQARIIRESGCFDAAWYLAGNPDVAASGIDPVLHYLEHGAREGRSPSPGFDAVEYARRHKLADTDINPLLHQATTAGAKTEGADEGGGGGEEP